MAEATSFGMGRLSIGVIPISRHSLSCRVDGLHQHPRVGGHRRDAQKVGEVRANPSQRGVARDDRQNFLCNPKRGQHVPGHGQPAHLRHSLRRANDARLVTKPDREPATAIAPTAAVSHTPRRDPRAVGSAAAIALENSSIDEKRAVPIGGQRAMNRRLERGGHVRPDVVQLREAIRQLSRHDLLHRRTVDRRLAGEHLVEHARADCRCRCARRRRVRPPPARGSCTSGCRARCRSR